MLSTPSLSDERTVRFKSSARTPGNLVGWGQQTLSVTILATYPAMTIHLDSSVLALGKDGDKSGHGAHEHPAPKRLGQLHN
jgi:hypothetical protein